MLVVVAEGVFDAELGNGETSGAAFSGIELSRERLGEREKDCGREGCCGDVPHF